MCALKSPDQNVMDLSAKLFFSKPEKTFSPFGHFNFLALMQNHYLANNQLSNGKSQLKRVNDTNSTLNVDPENNIPDVSTPEPAAQAESPVEGLPNKHKSLKDSIKRLPHRKRPINYDNSEEKSPRNDTNGVHHLSPLLFQKTKELKRPLESFQSISSVPEQTHLKECDNEMLQKHLAAFSNRVLPNNLNVENLNHKVSSPYEILFKSNFINDSTKKIGNASTNSSEFNGSAVKNNNGLLKDESYWERRRKNNEAAKRSRDTRRQKEEDIAKTAQLLAEENLGLKAQIKILKNELSSLHSILFYHTRPSD